MSEKNEVTFGEKGVSAAEVSAMMPRSNKYPETQAMLNSKFDAVSKPESDKDSKSVSSNGGVAVEARDVNADVKATIGVDKVDNSVKVGDNSTLTINNDNSKTVNKNRFDKAIGMSSSDTSVQHDSAGLEK